MEVKNIPDKHCKMHQWLLEERSQCVDQQRPLGNVTQVAQLQNDQRGQRQSEFHWSWYNRLTMSKMFRQKWLQVAQPHIDNWTFTAGLPVSC